MQKLMMMMMMSVVLLILVHLPNRIFLADQLFSPCLCSQQQLSMRSNLKFKSAVVLIETVEKKEVTSVYIHPMAMAFANVFMHF